MSTHKKSRSLLHEYQKKLIELIKEKKKYGLFLDPGCGKTIIMLTTIKDLLDSGEITKCLIVAPIQVCKDTWPKEIENWDHLKDIKFQLCLGSAKQRLKALNEPAQVYIINRENIPWLCEIKSQILWLKDKQSIQFDMIAIDESTSFKNPSAKRFKCIKKYFHYNYMICASGTPSPKSMVDLWSQIYMLDNGERLGKTFFKYVNDYFSYNEYSRKYKCIDHNKIIEKISDICSFLKAEDYLNMPKIMFNYISVSLPNIDEYKKYKRQSVMKFGAEMLTAANAGVLTNKLLQFCSGAIYTADNKYITVHDAKLDMLESMIDDNPSETFLVAYNFKSDLERLKNRFKHAVVLDGSKEIIEKWNKKEIPLLLAHPASSGKGLNLQFGGNNIIWFTLTWNLEDYLQFNARLYRQGQPKPVIIHHIIAKHCIDELVVKSLQNKDMSQSAFLESLRYIE